MRRIFELLLEWSLLPAYKLENRVDIFFGWFLPDILAVKGERVCAAKIFPEFPHYSKRGNQSSRCDFMVFDQAGGPIIVELKTDAASLDEDQSRQNRQLLEDGAKWRDIASRLPGIWFGTLERDKYFALLTRLANQNLFPAHPLLASGRQYAELGRSEKMELSAWLRGQDLETFGSDAEIKVYYIAPDNARQHVTNPFVYISLSEVAQILRNIASDDSSRRELAEVFAQFLDDLSHRQAH